MRRTVRSLVLLATVCGCQTPEFNQPQAEDVSRHSLPSAAGFANSAERRNNDAPQQLTALNSVPNPGDVRGGNTTPVGDSAPNVNSANSTAPGTFPASTLRISDQRPVASAQATGVDGTGWLLTIAPESPSETRVARNQADQESSAREESPSTVLRVVRPTQTWDQRTKSDWNTAAKQSGTLLRSASQSPSDNGVTTSAITADGTAAEHGVAYQLPRERTSSKDYLTAPVQHTAGAYPRLPQTVRYVNSKSIKLNYRRNGASPPESSAVELWCTRDTHTWKRYGAAVQDQPPYVIKVAEEGLYGFTLIPFNENGNKAPQPGDQPQIWVEVDLTKPVVRMFPVEVYSDGSGWIAKIRWTATDKNFGPRPVKLSYAEQPAGPWMTIAADLANSGSYAWQMPANRPSSFFVRVEVKDLAGNVGTDQSSYHPGRQLSPSAVSIDID